MARPKKFRLSPDQVLDPQNAAKLAGHVAEIELWRKQIEELQGNIADVYDAASEDGFDNKFIRKVVAIRAKDETEREHEEYGIDAYTEALEIGFRSRARVENPAHDPITGEIIEPTGNGAGVAVGEAVANDAKPSAQHSEPASGAGTVADGAGKPETSDASSAEIPGSHIPAQPNGADPRTPVDAATVGETADHSEPAEVPPPPPSAAPGDGSAAHPSAAPVVANVVQMRSHNPETHFLNSTGLSRLHGCLKPDMCGSSQPRAKLCFSCSVKHDGPTYQAVAE